MAAGEGLRDSSRLRKRCELHRGNACDGVRELRHPVSGNDPGAASGEGCGEALPDSTAGADDQGLRGRHSRAGKPLLQQARRPRLGRRDERNVATVDGRCASSLAHNFFFFHSSSIAREFCDENVYFCGVSVPMRASPVPCVVRGSFVLRFVRFGQKLLRLTLAACSYLVRCVHAPRVLHFLCPNFTREIGSLLLFTLYATALIITPCHEHGSVAARKAMSSCSASARARSSRASAGGGPSPALASVS